MSHTAEAAAAAAVDPAAVPRREQPVLHPIPVHSKDRGPWSIRWRRSRRSQRWRPSFRALAAEALWRAHWCCSAAVRAQREQPGASAERARERELGHVGRVQNDSVSVADKAEVRPWKWIRILWEKQDLQASSGYVICELGGDQKKQTWSGQSYISFAWRVLSLKDIKWMGCYQDITHPACMYKMNGCHIYIVSKPTLHGLIHIDWL